MPQVLVRNLEKHTLEALKVRAGRHRTSLQSELKRILEEASRPVAADALNVAKRIQANLRKKGIVFADGGRSQAEDRPALNRCVVDASVALKWYVPEIHSEPALRLLESQHAGDLAPLCLTAH